MGESTTGPTLLGAASDIHDLGLVLVVGLRSLATQRDTCASPAVIGQFARLLTELDPTASDEDIVERLSVMVAATPKTAGHTAGAAVDVSVRHRDGSDLDRGGPYLELSERMPMSSPFVTGEQAAARELVTTAMARHGLITYPYEFWHYSRGDALAAVAADSDEVAVYGPVDAAADGSVTPIGQPLVALHAPATLVAAVRGAMREHERAAAVPDDLGS